MDGPVVGSAVFELRAIRQKLKQDLDDSRRDLIGWIDQAERDAGAGGNRIGGAISGLVGKMTTVVTGLVTLLGLAAAGALNLGVQGLRMADDLANSARKVGVGTDALQEWRFVAQQTGADAKDADKALDSFANKLAQATAGTSKSAVKAFGFLKIGPEELRGFKSTEEALDYVTDAIKNLKSEADRAAIAEQLGLGPLSNALRDSAVDVATLRDEARSLGIVMDQEMIRRASAAQGEFDTLSQVIDIQLKSAFIDLVPAIMTVVGWVSQLAVALSDAMDAWRQLDDRTTRGLDRQLQRLTVENSNLMLRYGSVEAMKGREADRAAVVGASGGAAGPGGAIMARSMGPNAYETFTRNQEQINEIYRLKNERALTSAPQRTDRTTGGTLDIPAPRVPVDRSAEREARRAERVESEINKLRARALGIIDEETMTVQQRFDSETAQLEAERAAERAQLDSREARKDITKAERQQLDAANREVALREDRVRNAILLRDLDAERIAQERMVSDLTVQLLSLQSGAAKSAAARRVIELDLLKEAQRRAREDLQRDPNFLKASPQAQKAMIADQDRVFKAQTEGVIRDTMGPLDQWRDRALTDADQIREAYERVAVDGLDALNAGLVDAIVNSRNLGDVFSNVARQIIADLAAIAVRQSITEPLARSLFGGGDIATTGAKTASAAQGVSWLTKIAGFLGFAGGGRVSGPGSDKSDSILARLSNGEFVINAEQTRRHLPLLEMINGGGLPGFANGGLAMGMTPDGDGSYVTLSGPSEVTL